MPEYDSQLDSYLLCGFFETGQYHKIDLLGKLYQYLEENRIHSFLDFANIVNSEGNGKRLPYLKKIVVGWGIRDETKIRGITADMFTEISMVPPKESDDYDSNQPTKRWHRKIRRGSQKVEFV